MVYSDYCKDSNRTKRYILELKIYTFYNLLYYMRLFLDGTTFKKKVTFVDKPFTQSTISNLDIAYMSFKRLVKTNFCQFEAFK